MYKYLIPVLAAFFLISCGGSLKKSVSSNHFSKRSDLRQLETTEGKKLGLKFYVAKTGEEFEVVSKGFPVKAEKAELYYDKMKENPLTAVSFQTCCGKTKEASFELKSDHYELTNFFLGNPKFKLILDFKDGSKYIFGKKECKDGDACPLEL